MQTAFAWRTMDSSIRRRPADGHQAWFGEPWWRDRPTAWARSSGRRRAEDHRHARQQHHGQADVEPAADDGRRPWIMFQNLPVIS